MAFFEKALEASVMSTSILIRANVSKRILFEAYKIATDFESRYSAYKKDSFLHHINRVGFKEKIPCTEEDLKLFRRCEEASLKSDGVFDISIGALSHGAYHFGFKNQKIAQPEELKKLKKLVDFKSILLDEDGIFLNKEGMRLDLGAIGKGYVAKLIAIFLQEKGASKALIDVGGEIVSFGKSYTIAIKDPFSEGNLGFIKTSKEALSISTSGDYERYIKERENNHILNVKSGKSSNLYSGVVIIQNGFEIDMLDAYATAMFNKDIDYVKDFSKRENFAVIIIDRESNILLSNTKNLKINSIELEYEEEQ